MKPTLRLTIALALMVMATAAQAALRSSDNYHIESDSINAGGELLESASYRLEGTLGQPVSPAQGTSISYTLRSGYSTTPDSDANGTPDDIDTDDDNDGTLDASDAFPRDLSETTDTDGDRIGNNSDLDDDGDGMSDTFELEFDFDPLDPADGSADADADGLSNAEEFLAGRNPLVNEGAIINIINSSDD